MTTSVTVCSDVLRAHARGASLRATPAGEGGGASSLTLHGHFAVLNVWTEIDSMWEGRFMERIAAGAFTDTFARDRDRIRCLFQHGRDPQIGDKPLGTIVTLREDAIGARYEVELLDDTAYVHDLIAGLKAGLYGASFRFQVLRERIDHHPTASAHNPEALPERTILQAQVSEFGPVTFPAYPAATAAVRSLTDWWTHA